MLLEVTFGKLYAWAIQNVRNILLDANAKFKELGESRCCFLWRKLFYINITAFFQVPNNKDVEILIICVENYFDFVFVCCSNLPTLTPC